MQKSSECEQEIPQSQTSPLLKNELEAVSDWLIDISILVGSKIILKSESKSYVH